MKTVLILLSCFFLLSCTTRTRKAEAVHSPYDTVSVYAKDEEGQKIYNVVSEKAVTANGDSLFDKRRAEVPKQLSDKEFELAKTLVRRYVDSHQDSYLPFDSYFQQYLGYKRAGVLMADVALFSSYNIVYQQGVAGITREDYRVKFKYLKDLGKERKMLTINLDKGVIVRE
jgi:putative lipoprotein